MNKCHNEPLATDTLYSDTFAVDMLEDEIEEEIVFSPSGNNEEYNDEDIRLQIELCIPFGTRMFPHHEDTFLQALCELVLSPIEMTCQKHVPHYLDDFGDGELSPVIPKEPTAVEHAIGEPALFGCPKSTTGCSTNTMHSTSMYTISESLNF